MKEDELTDYEWVEKGLKYAQEKNYQDAITCYEKAIDLNDKYEDAWLNLGITLEMLGDIDQAVASYEVILEMNPSSAEALTRLQALKEKEIVSFPTLESRVKGMGVFRIIGIVIIIGAIVELILTLYFAVSVVSIVIGLISGVLTIFLGVAWLFVAYNFEYVLDRFERVVNRLDELERKNASRRT